MSWARGMREADNTAEFPGKVLRGCVTEGIWADVRALSHMDIA